MVYLDRHGQQPHKGIRTHKQSNPYIRVRILSLFVPLWIECIHVDLRTGKHGLERPDAVFLLERLIRD